MAKRKQPRLHPNPAFDESKMPNQHATGRPDAAVGGAVTHPGAKKESHVFADIQGG